MRWHLHTHTAARQLGSNLKESWEQSRIFHWMDKRISRGFQRRLHNDQFTILCSNCIGGVIYHRLGKQFLSPTVNMFFSQPDFVEFCVNLDYFLKQELQFQEEDTPYPIAKLRGDGETVRDITLHFNHDRDPEIARNKWNERKQRIKKDNLYIILYYLDGLTINQLKRHEKVPCKNKVVLSKEPLAEILWSVCIKPNKRKNMHPVIWGRMFLEFDILRSISTLSLL